jgi:SAM-dependent methyltransferase
MTKGEPPVVARWQGRCPVCEQDTIFEARDAWLRDHLICQSCPGGSIPRERAMMQVLRELAPDWIGRSIHESSPGNRGASVILARHCRDYIATQFYQDVPRGAFRDGMRCEDLEQQTFDDQSFDLVITQDVMEHVFHPDQAYREIWRTLKPGGLYLHTTPIYKDRVITERRASIGMDGKVVHLAEPEYHGNPVDPAGSLVTFHYGYDLADLIAEWTAFDVEIRRFHQRRSGIVAEFSEVIICRKVEDVTFQNGR